jgi:hypothetical protein
MKLSGTFYIILICKYASFSKVGGNYPLDLKIIWSSDIPKLYIIGKKNSYSIQIVAKVKVRSLLATLKM